MEIQPPRQGSMAPPPGTGQRGFDQLANPLGWSLVAICILMFTVVCYHGARWVRRMSQAGVEERRRLREDLARARAIRDERDAS